MTVIAEPIERRSMMRSFFDNRIVRFFALFFLTTGAYVGAQILPVVTMPHIAAENREIVAIAISAISAVALLLVYWLFVRLMEHRAVGELAVRKAPGGVIAGALIGLGLFAGVIGTLYAMGIATIQQTSGQNLLGAANMAVL